MQDVPKNAKLEKLKDRAKAVQNHIKENKEAYVIGAFVGVVVGYEILLRKEKAKVSTRTDRISAKREDLQHLIEKGGRIEWDPKFGKLSHGRIILAVTEDVRTR